MYLSKLEILGFKSFAQKTNFRFSSGLSALVGPNGCGKTNIVDAIRWVLGEQKTSVLRSEVMENVIFNGTTNRKPLGMSEVSLTVENNKNLLPSEYTEITLTRRLFRNGESQYLLNNTQCRLKDIIDMFMDTGMGADSYSVIELKMIESILSGRLEERRHLFEEAAGITKYKIRKKEAEKKLGAVQGDLIRIQDIVTEVRKNAAILSRQAAKTNRYNKIFSQLKEVEIELLFHEFHDFKSAIQPLKNEINKLANEKTQIEKDIEENEFELNDLNENFSALENDFIKASDTENRLNLQTSQINKDIAVSNEKKNSLIASQERLHQEIEDSNDSLKRNEKNLNHSKERLLELSNSIADLNDEIDNIKSMRNENYQNVIDLRNRVSDANEEVINTNNKIKSINDNLNRSKQRKQTLELRIRQSNEEIIKVRQNSVNLAKQKETIQEQKKNLESKFKDADSKHFEAQEQKNKLDAEIKKFREQIADKKNSLNQKRANLDFLKGLIISGDSTRFLLQTKDWQPDFEKLLLSELVGCDDQYRIAIDAALGEYAQLLVVNNKIEAEQAINILKTKDKGKVSFLCRNEIPIANEPSAPPQNIKNFGWASEIVRVDDILRNALRLIFGKTLLVESIEDALKAINNKEIDCAVTLKGEFIRSNCIVRGGSLAKNEGISIGKKEKTENLIKEIKKLEEDILKLQSNLDSTLKEFNSIDLNYLFSERKKAEQEVNSNEQLLSKITYQLESIESNIKMLEENFARYDNEKNELESEEQDFTSETETLQNDLEIAKDELNVLSSELVDAEQILNEWDQNSRNTDLKKVRFETEMKNLEKDISRIEYFAKSTTEKISNLEKEIQNNEEAILILNENVKNNEENLKLISDDAAKAQAEKDLLTDKINLVKDNLKSVNDLLIQKRKSLEKIQTEIHSKDLKLGEINISINSLITKGTENHNVDLENLKIKFKPDFQPELARKNIYSLRDKLSAFGSVNFMALEEFEEQNQRLQFYEAQVKDLIDSEKTLQETIVEINRTACEKFLETFTRINFNFKNLFKELFGGDSEGNLKIEGEDPLEANISIYAKPPAKKPQTIDLLSQGEKTLTAIALLFSIYLVKPSPFCILDEVDAPLDDSNIDKFLELIHKFSENTQFIVVTHNKRTMEAADSLYGVTMQEEGVSKVVSVKLSNFEKN